MRLGALKGEELDRFGEQARLGRLALFSVRVEDARATLAIEPVEETARVTTYRVAQMAGPGTREPEGMSGGGATAHRSPEFTAAASRDRRRCLGSGAKRCWDWLGLVVDMRLATDRWGRFVTPGLPRRFCATSPAEVVRFNGQGRH